MACGCAKRREMIKSAFQAGGTKGVFRAMPTVVKHMVSKRDDKAKRPAPTLFKR